MSQTPPLLLQGSLRQISLPELLVRALDERLEGTLVLQPPGGQTPGSEKHAVLFLGGAPAKARPAGPLVSLAGVLRELDLVRPDRIAAAERTAAAGGQSLENRLLEEGALDSTLLFVALREQLTRQVLALCDLPRDTAFGLYRANYLAAFGPLSQWRVKPLPLVWRALSEHLPADRTQAILRGLGARELKLRFESPVSRYHLTPDEQAIVDFLKIKALGLPALEEAGVGSEDLVRRVVVALVLSRQLELAETGGQPVGTSEPPETPNSIPPPSFRAARNSITAPRVPQFGKAARTPDHLASGPGASSPAASGGADPSVRAPGASTTGSKSPERPVAAPGAPAEGGTSLQTEALRQAILDWERHPPDTFYDLLGVDRSADPAAIRLAFFQLAKQWHPDRLPAALADLRPVATRAFARMGEAHQLLSDPRARAEYDAKLKEAPDAEAQQVTTIINAAGAFQRAEVLMRKKDLAGALAEAESAHQGDPDQAEYVALYAWLLVQTGGDTERALALLNPAIEREPENVKALWYRVLLNKKLGKEVQAMRDCKRILQIKPQHVDAARELRFYEMRRRTGGAPDSSRGGLLGRFRKKV